MVTTGSYISQNDKAYDVVARRIRGLRLKNAVIEMRFIYEATSKTSLRKCDDDDPTTLLSVLDRVEAGDMVLPAGWYSERNGDKAPGDSNDESSN